MDNTNIKNEAENKKNFNVVESNDGQKNDKKPKTPKEMTFFVLRIVGNVLFYSAIVVLFFFSLMNINAGRRNGIPNIFGNGYLRVLTPSMHVTENNKNNLPEEYNNYKIKQFNCSETETVDGKEKITYKGDVVNVKMTGKGYFNKFKVGDVVTYWDDNIEIDGRKTGGYNTHRIVCIGKDSDGKSIIVYTAGDKDVSEKYELREEIETLRSMWDKFANGTEAEKAEAKSWIYDYEAGAHSSSIAVLGNTAIKAKVTSVNYKAGYTIWWMQQYWLFIFVIPLAVILIVEVVLVVRNIILLRKEKNKALAPEGQIDLESEKERMRAELLAELRNQGVIAAAAAEAPAAEEPKVEETPAEEVKEDTVEPAEAPQEEAKAEEVTEAEPEKVEEAPVENNEVVAEEAPREEAPVTEEATKEEEPVVNNDEATSEPDMSIEENEEPKVEEKKAPTKKAPVKKTSTTKKASTKKTE